MSYLLPLGPFHPSWRGPMRFVLRVEGERIIDVEYRDGYAERGSAERIGRVSIPQAIHLVNHLCAADTIAHSSAFCQAIEQIGGIILPERGAVLRMIAAEIERAQVHVGVLIEAHRILGLERDADYLGRLEVALREVMQHLCGTATQPNYVLPGGVRLDLSNEAREKMAVHLRRVERLMYRFIDGFIDHRGVLRRTVGVGILGREAAEQFGVRGPLARATGINYDARIDRPYAAYADFVPSRVTQERGDVYSRLVVMVLEAFESLKLVIRMLAGLPAGEWMGNAPDEVAAGSATAAVESARGALRYSVESNGMRLTSVRIDAPRQFDRLLARTLLAGMAIDDAGLIIASAGPCVACAEA